MSRTLGEAVEESERRLLNAGLFFGHGSASAYDEAAYLVLYSLGLPPDDLESVWERPLTPEEQKAIETLIQRRVDERMPAAYLTGEAWLAGHRFQVDRRVIVPRSFLSELLAEEFFPWCENPEEVTSVLDLCTGSGCLAILAALAFPNAAVDAADLSPDAIAVARCNVDDYQLKERVRLAESDMFGALQGQRYDLILCNPPYVTAESMAHLPEEYRREPQMALASGEDGLDHLRVLLRDAPAHLSEGGLLAVEVGFNREGVEAAFPKLPFTWVEVSAGDDIVFLLTREELTNSR